MDLRASYAYIGSRLERRRKQGNAILLEYAGGSLTPWKHRFLSESLLSNTWIDWNVFVKSVLVASCNGTSTRAGIAFPQRAVPDNSEPRITHEVQRYTVGKTPTAGTIYSGPMEPTWARPDKIVTCINGLAPSNLAQLQAAFGSANIIGPNRIHLVRNSCAHKSLNNRQAVKALLTDYSANPYKDPIDIIWGTNQATNAVAFFEWLSDLEDIANLATQ